MKIETSNVISQRLDDISHFGEYNQKKWVAIDDILKHLRTISEGYLKVHLAFTIDSLNKLIKELK